MEVSFDDLGATPIISNKLPINQVANMSKKEIEEFTKSLLVFVDDPLDKYILIKRLAIMVGEYEKGIKAQAIEAFDKLVEEYNEGTDKLENNIEYLGARISPMSKVVYDFSIDPIWSDYQRQEEELKEQIKNIATLRKAREKLLVKSAEQTAKEVVVEGEVIPKPPISSTNSTIRIQL